MNERALRKIEADRDREILIRYLESYSTRLERLWLPILRLVHKWCTR